MNIFISIGIAILVGIIFGRLMNKIKIPAVAGYILAGLVLGVSGFNIISQETIEILSFVSDFALCIIAFNIGSELEFVVIKKLGKTIISIAIFESMTAFLLVSVATYLFTGDPAMALILGAVSSATAPAATVMVLKEFKAKGTLTSTLLGVVAIDDAICLIIYSMAAAVAKVFVNHEVITVNKVLLIPLAEIGLSILVGVILGIVLNYISKYAKRDADLLCMVVAVLLVVDGIATQFSLSPLLTSMAVGITIGNVSKQKRRIFSTIESFSPPIITSFFILAGARLNIYLIPVIGVLGLIYLVTRIIGKITGAYIGATIGGAPIKVRKYLGFGLLSQVGVAVGLAITVSREFPGEMGATVMAVLLVTTIATEIIGPLMTKLAIIKSGEANI